MGVARGAVQTGNRGQVGDRSVLNILDLAAFAARSPYQPCLIVHSRIANRRRTLWDYVLQSIKWLSN